MKSKDVISKFTESLTIDSKRESDSDVILNHYLELLKRISDAFDETFYLLDLKQIRFHLISSKGLFLNILFSKKGMESEFDFYQIVHKNDHLSVEIMFQTIFDFFKHPHKPIPDLAYFVFDFIVK